ncbi:hypothetical protein [Porphyromonas macacae]|uniref:hypothetical protein n=1 Tax=Porphyromonas macacae TaxID=28115 RepID=UPI001269AF20|nr:hypothetical protein [Porphyromonas macacae]
MNFDTAPFSCIRMCKVQGTKTEAQRSILKYVIETEGRKQRSNLRMMTHCLFYYTDTFSLVLSQKTIFPGADPV